MGERYIERESASEIYREIARDREREGRGER